MRSTPEIETPEAWDLNRIRLAVQAIADGTDVGHATSLSGRHVGYHIQAARILGWVRQVDGSPVLTDAGRELLRTPVGSADETLRMREAVERAPVVEQVVPQLFSEISIDAIAQLLHSDPLTVLAESTAKKRAATLVRWRDRVRSATTGPGNEKTGLALSAQRPLDRLLVLHLSDIHVRTDDELQILLARAPKIAASLAARPELCGVSTCVVIVSGDVAFSGTADQYALADAFLERLSAKLSERFPAISLHVVIAPGNHDCDFKKHTKARERLITDVDPQSIDQSYIDSCTTTTQEAFWKFCERWHNDPARVVSAGTAVQVHELRLGQRLIRVHALNTAWMSTLEERQGNLVFPSAGIDILNAPCAEPDAVISVRHHADNWLEANNARDLRNAIERVSDAILTGHEHVADHNTKTGSSGQSSWHIEGGVLLDSKDTGHSTFNAIALDLEQSALSIMTFSWNSKDAIYQLHREFASAPFQRNQYRLRSEFQLTASFSAQLEDPGEPYHHPRKAPVRLSDIFVYPDLKERLYERTGVDAERVVRDVVEHVVSQQTVILFAPELAGKTAMARTLFVDLHRRGFVPVLLDGRELDNPSSMQVHARIDASFRRAYDPDLLERYRQLEPSKRAIIVDDFHRSPLHIGAKEQVSSVLVDFAEVTVIFVDEAFELAALRGHAQQEAVLWEFTHSTILPLGHRVRYDLVSRWCSLGRGHADDPATISRETEHRDRSITHLLGQNFLPAYPAFVLLCLQQLEIKTPESSLGSFGHLYEALLTRSILAGGSASSMDLDAKQQFLSELAFRIYQSGQDTVDSHEFGLYYQEYCDVFHVTFPRDRVEKELVNSSILLLRSGRYSFRYKYAYLFFVARYIRDHLEEQRVKTTVVDLCGRLYHDASANILLFLCHLSKHPFVLDTLLSQARSLFPNAASLDVETALTPLGRAPSATPLELSDGDHHENRRQARDLRDRLEPTSPAPEEHDGLPREVMEISAAFKTVQILGQVLRGFPGSIPGDRKLEIATECYSLGLRAAQALISYVIDAREEIEEMLVGVISARRPGIRETPDKLKQAARSLLYDLCESMCFGTVRHISDAVGLQTLSRTYEEVLRKEKQVSFKIVDLAVHLDHFDEFPHSRVDALLREVGSKFLPLNLVRRLVWRHLYIFQMPQAQIQSLCSKLDIKFTRALQSAGKGGRR